jgi:hypothetical protein
LHQLYLVRVVYLVHKQTIQVAQVAPQVEMVQLHRVLDLVVQVVLHP